MFYKKQYITGEYITKEHSLLLKSWLHNSKSLTNRAYSISLLDTTIKVYTWKHWNFLYMQVDIRNVCFISCIWMQNFSFMDILNQTLKNKDKKKWTNMKEFIEQEKEFHCLFMLYERNQKKDGV